MRMFLRGSQRIPRTSEKYQIGQDRRRIPDDRRFNGKTFQGGVVMAVNESAVLIEAVKRYVKSETYPSVETICSILGIEEVKKCETRSEKQKRDR